MIANRTIDKAQTLRDVFQSFAKECGVQLSVCPMNALGRDGAPIDLIINATAAGLGADSPISDAVAKRLFKPTAFAYDMVYGKITGMMQQAIHHGCRVSDGLGMLVEQAADAFLIWRGAEQTKALDTRTVLADLRREITTQ